MGRLVEDVYPARLVFPVRVAVIGVERRSDDHVLQSVAVNVRDGHAVAEISAQLLSGDFAESGQLPIEQDDLFCPKC